MLIDTSSAVSLVHEDVWREATELPVDLLTLPVRPIVVANGGELDLLGQDERGNLLDPMGNYLCCAACI